MSRLLPGQIYDDRYKLLEFIGGGGFGQVWKAEQIDIGTILALKIVAPNVSLKKDLSASIVKEYRETQNLKHSNILVPGYCAFDKHGMPYLTMPYCKNGTSQTCKNLSAKEIVEIIFEIASGLEYLHGESQLHNDVKPANILISDSKTCMLADFGVSGRNRRTVIQRTQGKIKGTVSYSAPELFGTHPIQSEKTDIFSLGVTLYEICTGDLPWQGGGGIFLKSGANIPKLPPKYGDGLNTLLTRCLQLRPEDRPTDQELKRSIEDYREPTQPQPWTLKDKFVFTLVLLALVLLPSLLTFYYALELEEESSNKMSSLYNRAEYAIDNLSDQIDNLENVEFQVGKTFYSSGGHDKNYKMFFEIDHPITLKSVYVRSNKTGNIRIKLYTNEDNLIETSSEHAI